MEFGELSTRTTAEICETLGAAVGEEEKARIGRIIEKAIIEVVADTSQRCAKAAATCFGPEADMAHKIAERIKEAQTALIANLSSFR